MFFKENLFYGLKTQLNNFYFPRNRTALSRNPSWFSSEIGAAIKQQLQKRNMQ